MNADQLREEARKAGLLGVEEHFALQVRHRDLQAHYAALQEQVRALREEKASDSNVEDVRRQLLERSQCGVGKYGVTTEREDLSPGQWLQHLLEELCDAAVYVRRLQREVEALDLLGEVIAARQAKDWRRVAELTEEGR